MKSLKSIVAIIALVGVTQFMSAQKVAHINMQQLIENHPDMLSANKQLETIAGTYDKDYAIMVTEFTNKRDKYISEEGTTTEAVNQERAVELQNMQKSIQDFYADAQKKLSEKELELKKPIADKVTEAIQKVAKAKGYEYVLDATVGSGVLYAAGIDIMADVKTELGI
ncbi:MAG: OmpH family outer membrane protein [Flavobacteriaceae bacterium]